MPSNATVILIAVVAYAVVFAITRIALSAKEFKIRSPEDQARARAKIRQSLIVLPFALAAACLLWLLVA